jgi:prophage tail gpP-like protein
MPQGDPTKADRGTTATLVIDGLSEPLGGIVQFSVSDDILQVGDTMNCVVPDPRNTLWKKIQLYAGYKFYLQNPNIDGGTPCLRQTGVIRAREKSASLGGGDVISLRGSDLGWHLQTSAPPFFRLDQATIRDITQKVIDDNPAWGFRGVRDNNDLNRKLKQGRQGEQIRLNPSRLSPYMVIQVEPGQQYIQVIQEFARRDGLMVNVSADGYIQLFNPNYNQPTSFQVNYHPAGTAEARTNNVIEPTSVEENGDEIYDTVSVVWQQLYVGVRQGPFRPNIGRHVALYTRSDGSAADLDVATKQMTTYTVSAGTAQLEPRSLGPPFPRNLVVSDAEPMTPEQGARRAFWESQRHEFNAFIYRCKLVGHSQNGKWLTSDTLAAVNDSVRGVRGVLYAPMVRHDGDSLGGNTTYIELRRPGLLSNTALVLNQIVDNGDGTFSEVTVPG